MTGDRMIHLGAFLLGGGHHIAAWRHPSVPSDAATNISHYRNVAAIAERGLFDMVFLADFIGLTDAVLRDGRSSQQLVALEPLTALAAIAGTTERIGLVATASTSFETPYQIARQFASLDQISGGRSGWNVVTSYNEADAAQYGKAVHLELDERYRRAEEFVDVVTSLWDSWNEDAFVHDKKSGTFFEPTRVRRIDHAGEYYAVQGPLNVPRSPQGRPVIVQAGSSGSGIELGARTAEVVFTAQAELDGAREYAAAIRARMPSYGRDAGDLVVMPGLFPVVAPTAQAAAEKYQYLQDLIDIDSAIRNLSRLFLMDVSGYPLDEPMPELPLDELLSHTRGSRSRPLVVFNEARANHFTLRETALKMAGSRGHHVVVGTPADIADRMQEWFEAGAADGFNILAPLLPGGLEDFVDLVVPELQRRGLYRTEYSGATLRDNLGLPLPVGIRC